jgi:hypothetical protein
MRTALKHTILIAVCILLRAAASSQVGVRANVDRDNILIGQNIKLSVEAYVPTGSAVTWFAPDSIPHFEILNISSVDTAQTIDVKKFTQVFSLTSFDSGQQYIPPFDITVNDQHYYTDSITINVSYAPFDPKEDYRDIKDIIDIRNPMVKFIPWALLATALVSALLLVFGWYKRKFTTTALKKVNTPTVTPFEEAMKALAELGKRQITNGEVKMYYSEMNDILRNYVSRKFSVTTFERTNEELILELSGRGIPKDAFVSLAQSLRMSDFVKFAKYRPDNDENRQNLQVVTSAIEILDKNYASAV